jgi:polyhydroxybutyrate depolymerase
LAHDGLTRIYGVHRPPSYDGKTPAPIVIYLHGGGGSIKAAYKDGMDKATDKFGFFYSYPY